MSSFVSAEPVRFLLTPFVQAADCDEAQESRLWFVEQPEVSFLLLLHCERLAGKWLPSRAPQR
jgi:hypothetical protein